MSKTVETEMVFMKEECGTAEVKQEIEEEEDPLNLENGNNVGMYIVPPRWKAFPFHDQ